jgi:pimeloyl-ACP methyl ester carboxylesterase
MPDPVRPQRNAPDTWYPAGVPGVLARTLTLAGGEQVRLVEPVANAGLPADALLLHGWGCNAFHFRYLLPALSRRGIRSAALDLRGHGLSHKPRHRAAYTAPAMTRFVSDVLDALHIERVGLVGHSLGGGIALDFAVSLPRRVRWLSLLSPVGLARLRFARLLRLIPAGLGEYLPTAASRAIGAVALRFAYGEIRKPDVDDLAQYLFPTLLPSGRYGTLAYGRAFSWERRARDAIAQITCPMRVLFGDRDRVMPHAESGAWLRSIEHATVEMVPLAGHVLAEEVPEQVADSIRDLAAAEHAQRDTSPAATR